jgi:NADPH:quinone reductase-like Zn-dependent oxidoreductase
MKAIVQDEYSSPDVLQLRDIDKPNIGSDEVLVRVHAAGVDRGVGTDAEYARAREDKLAPKPANLTFEQAAVVPTSASTALEGLRDKVAITV